MIPPRRAITKAILSAGLALALAGCGALPTPVVRPTGAPSAIPSATTKPRRTRTPRPSSTPQPTQTPAAAPSATPHALPSAVPTLPFAVVSATSTLVPVTQAPPSPTPLALDCDLVWQSPRSVAIYNPADKFAVGWNIRNTGTETWEPGTFEFTYLAGARLATHDDRIPLTNSVAPGDEIVLSVPMKAPANPNRYTTHWGIRQGENFFCRLTLTISVH